MLAVLSGAFVSFLSADDTVTCADSMSRNETIFPIFHLLGKLPPTHLFCTLCNLEASQTTVALPDEEQGGELCVGSMAGAQGGKQTETVKGGGAPH